jgi:branched-chain amino acid transport system substrate-binding protein
MPKLNLRKFLIFSLVIALVAFGAVVLAQDDAVTVEPDGEVTVGFSAGLSGDVAALGIDIQRGLELALEDRSTVTVDGTEFDVAFDAQDSQCNAEGGQAVANRFASDDSIIGVVGPMCSSACEAAAPIFDSAGFTTISPSCTSPTLTLRGYSSFNRAVPSDGFQGAVAAEFMAEELGVTRIATIHDGSPYGEGLVEIVGTTFEVMGGEVVAADAINVGDTDFRALLEEIAAAEPELIYFGGFPAEAALLIQQRVDAGLQDTIFMGADGIRGSEVVELSGPEAEGIYASAPIATDSDALESFLERYVDTYGEEPPAPFHANGYDAINIFLDAVEATGTVDDDGNLIVNREAVSEYVRSLEDSQGLVGNLNADGTGETFTVEQTLIGVSQVQDGEFTLVETYGGEGDDMMEEEATEEPMMEEEVTEEAETDE